MKTTTRGCFAFLKLPRLFFRFMRHTESIQRKMDVIFMNGWYVVCLIPLIVMNVFSSVAHAAPCSYAEIPIELDGVKFCYPSFILSDSAVETAVNDHLASNARRLFSDWYQWPEGSVAEGKIMRVAVDDEQNVLSIMLHACFDITNSSHPCAILYAENYSTNDGSPINPLDFLSVERLSTLIRQCNVAQTAESDIEQFSKQLDYLSTMPGEALERTVDSASVFWQTGESFVIILPVPHDLGDYAVLSINKKQLFQ